MVGADKASIRWTDSGGPGRVVVFIHGWSCGLGDWDSQVRVLAAQFRCVAIDLPGHGDSQRPDRPGIDEMASGVRAVIEHLGINAAVLIGHSMGCRVALQTAHDLPGLIEGMVFIDGSMMQGDPAQVIERFEGEIARSGADALIDRLYDGFNVATTPAEVRAALARRRADADPGFLVPLFFDMVRWDTTRASDMLAKTDVPVMVIQSTLLDSTGTRVAIKEGETTPWTRAVRSHLPGARMVTIEGIGHFPMLEAAERTHRLISGFVQSLPERCRHDPASGTCQACG